MTAFATTEREGLGMMIVFPGGRMLDEAEAALLPASGALLDCGSDRH